MATKIQTEAEWLAAQIHKSRFGIHAVPCLLTPGLAEELIARNPDNRSVSTRRVELYANDMRSGLWSENGETIVVSRDGLLNDGQHRCHAVVMAKVSVPIMIVFGVERESRTTTNQGKAKGAGDYAGMQGIANANNIAAIARLAIAYEEGMALETSRISHTAVIQYIGRNNDELQRCWNWVGRFKERLRIVCAPTTVAFCYLACARVDQNAADQYFMQICSGEGIISGDPALVVRNKFLQMGKARGPKIEVIFHGWNAFRRSETRTQIRVNGTIPPLV